MATYSKAEQAVLEAHQIGEEEILYLTISTYFFNEIRTGQKNVEYRTLNDHYLSRLYERDHTGRYSQPKPLRYLLLQAGYSAHSPRLIVELKGWTVGDNIPSHAGLDLEPYIIFMDDINLLLGKVVYDSWAGKQVELVQQQSRSREVEKRQVERPDYLKPINIVEVQYEQTGLSKQNDALGMRPMQARAYQARLAQYLLLKAPPASGKSRALMFIALDKLVHQGIRKAIIAVPERSIGSSFAPTELKKYGFFADWELATEYNLCLTDTKGSKVESFCQFLESSERILLCTHATLRFAYEALRPSDFDDCLVAIDEFHHVSASEDNRLGELLRGLMEHSSAHIVAMTGSYFRGDAAPVLLPQDEERFVKVSYNYYDQLNGYEYLKSLGIGYHFYRGRYYEPDAERNGLSALAEILDEDLKTIIHIPNVNSAESSKMKYEEVSHIIDCLGEYIEQDPETGIITVESRKTGRLLRVADLVHDVPEDRDRVVNYLRQISSPDDLDMIIALGMAKEGFDWPYCEHALTIGYRSSLTEIIQIIGRATRDSRGKLRAQFTNLIAAPDADDDEVKVAVNNMIKAISASLLMEQVLAPNFKFKPKDELGSEGDEAEGEEDGSGSAPLVIKINGFKLPSSQRAMDILEHDLVDLKASILQHPLVQATFGSTEQDQELVTRQLVPMIIREKYPDLDEEELESINQHVLADSLIKASDIVEQGGKKFITMAKQFINIDDIDIDMIYQINPFQRSFEILSKHLTPQVLKAIQENIATIRMNMSLDEAMALWHELKAFTKSTGKLPDINSTEPQEQRLAVARLVLLEENERRQKAKKEEEAEK